MKPVYSEIGRPYKIRDPLRDIMHGMRQRCYYEKRKDYAVYGGRGIVICEEWMTKREGINAFINWSRSHGYKQGLLIDRIDCNGPYSPENCRWVNNANSVRNSSMAKLTVKTAKIAAFWIIAGLSDTQTGTIVGVHRRTINDIRRAVTWSDVSGFGGTAHGTL